MRGSDYFLIILTFFTGVFVGVYVYVTGFAPDYVYDPLVQTKDITFELSGQMYGGCQRQMEQCARFTILENRAYEYQPAHPRDTATPKAISGVLARETLAQLVAEIERTNLMSLDQQAIVCASATDGTDYRYRLVYEGKEYFLDTCGTVFADSRLAAAFSGLWLQVATTTSWVDSVSDFRPDTYFSNWLYQRLHGTTK